MTSTQLGAAIKHLEKDLGGAGYFIRVYLISGTQVFGAILPSESGRPHILGIETVHEEEGGDARQTIFIDVAAIAAIKGPFMLWDAGK